MKKILLLSGLVLSSFAAAQIINFTDAKFKAKVLEASPGNQIAKDLSGNYTKIDANGDGQIQYSEARALSYLSVKSSGLTSLMGIEYFTNLTSLDCSSNSSLVGFDVSKLLKLTELNTSNTNSNTNITAIDFSKLVKLTNLNISNSGLSSLDVSKLTALVDLDCSSNRSISSLDVSQLVNLTNLNCASNSLTSLDVSQLPKLVKLKCNGNSLTSLKIGDLGSLTNLSCYSNKLTSLDLTKLVSLIDLNCGNNKLTTLDLSSLTSLLNLTVESNQLTNLDVSKLTNLTALNCIYNKIKRLDLSSTKVSTFYCYGNELTHLNLQNNVISKASCDFSHNYTLKNICCDENETNYIESIVPTGALYNKVAVNFDCDPVEFPVQAQTTLALSTVEKATDFSIYPNPATTVLNLVSTEEISKVEILDLQGQLIQSSQVANQKINVEALPKGTYFLRTKLKNKMQSLKFIKD
jgi:Leucine-rich repeat (LRR) protein